MNKQIWLDSIAKKIFDKLPMDLRQSKAGIDKAVHCAVTSVADKLNLVSREELDAQNKVLERASEQIKTLEHRIAELEQQLNNTRQ
ncbi:MAG: accessory factor UbiK family protein [Pseudomonadota bacterium]